MTKGRFCGPISRKRQACHRLCRVRLSRRIVFQVRREVSEGRSMITSSALPSIWSKGGILDREIVGDANESEAREPAR